MVRFLSFFFGKVERDSVYFPIPESVADQTLTVSYVDSWMANREYKGKSRHEGTDIMADKNERGLYPVISISDGMITNLGWLEKGGYRIGITSPSGVYYYYAHLESYAEIKEGDQVQAGEMLGFRGDSGYGEEGTTGQFPVHLLLGLMPLKMGRDQRESLLPSTCAGRQNVEILLHIEYNMTVYTKDAVSCISPASEWRKRCIYRKSLKEKCKISWEMNTKNM